MSQRLSPSGKPKPNQSSHPAQRKAQLRTVLWLRLFAVTTLMSVLGLAHGMDTVRLPWPALLFVLGLLLTLNVLAWIRLRSGQLGPYEVGAQLFADLFGFSVLLYFTGGATNPFVMFYLPLLGLAAAMLPWAQVLALAGFSILAYSVLMLEYIPLVLSKPQNAIELHLFGMWVNFLVSVAILVAFVARLSDRVRQRDQDLNTAQQRVSRDARLAALGNQAASLAHELGTPLSTAKIILSDWMDNKDGPEVSTFQQESLVVREQLERMEACLVQLRNSLEPSTGLHEGQSPADALPIEAWLSNWLNVWRNRNPQVIVNCSSDLPEALAGFVPRDSVELVLSNLLENAMQAYAKFATEQAWPASSAARVIQIRLHQSEGMLRFEVEDNAGGFDPDLLNRLGPEPLASESAEQHRGMGLFLAVGLIERAGGWMQFSQVMVRGNAVGARVVFTVPLQEVCS